MKRVPVWEGAVLYLLRVFYSRLLMIADIKGDAAVRRAPTLQWLVYDVQSRYLELLNTF